MFAFLDNTTNFAKSTIANAGGINSAVTSVTVATGDGAKFPSSNFNVVLWDVATYADPADDAGREIVRCTSRSSDVLTITRAQEGTTASSHAQNAGVMLAFTDKMRDDIEAYLQGKLGSDIASASTTDIGASTGQGVTVTGTTTITALGTADAGTYRRVTFSGALTLTHNATSLILPGSANITTSAGDVAYFVSLGSGNWKCEAFNKKDGTAVVTGGGGTTKIFEAHNTMMSAHAGSELYNTSVGFPSEDKWTDTASITPTYFANGVYLNTGGGGKLSLPLLGVDGTMHWNDGRNFATSIGCYFASDTSGSSGFGFSTEQIDWDSSTETSLRIGFESRSGPALKAVTADGTTRIVSADLDSNITYDRLAIFGIFVDVDTSTAYFYINGVLRATLSISTLASNSGQIGWNFSYGGQNVNHRVSEFIVSNEVY